MNKNIIKTKMNKKGEILARDWVMSIILFSGIIALFVISVGTMADNYGTENITSESFSENFDKFEETTNIAQEMWDKTSGEGGLSTVGTFEILFAATFGVISLIFSSVTNVISQMFSFVEYFGIPFNVGIIFFTTLLSLLFIIIVFIIISSVSRRDL